MYIYCHSYEKRNDINTFIWYYLLYLNIIALINGNYGLRMRYKQKYGQSSHLDSHSMEFNVIVIIENYNEVKRIILL